MTASGRRGLAIIGGGKIGEALLSGLVRRGGTDGILVCERSPERAAQLSERYGVPAVDLADAASRARVLLLAVKPQDIGVLLERLAGVVDDEHLVVSVAAGIPTKRIEAALPQGIPVVRVMPNTPALVDEGMSVLSAGAHAGEDDLDEAEALLAAVGRVRRVPEDQQDAALGSAVMMRDSGEHPVQLREAVTSPGGTTIAAVRELERHGVRAALIAAIEAAHDRSVELGADKS
jgi:pyrroline-5-carboxylate reductase